MLPTDFDIFSVGHLDHPVVHPDPRQRHPAGRLGLGDLVLVVGKTRSEPPPWIAKSVPSSFSAIAEHSMCQPGRPSPQGEGQPVSSSALRAFQSAKSSGSSFSDCGARLLALVHLVGVAVGELAVAVEAADPEVDVAAGLVGVAAPRSAPRSARRSRRSSRRPAARRPGGRARAGRCPRRRRGSSRAASSVRGHPGLARRVVDLVVDVGDVDDQPRLVALAREEARAAASEIT